MTEKVSTADTSLSAAIRRFPCQIEWQIGFSTSMPQFIREQSFTRRWAMPLEEGLPRRDHPRLSFMLSTAMARPSIPMKIRGIAGRNDRSPLLHRRARPAFVVTTATEWSCNYSREILSPRFAPPDSRRIGHSVASRRYSASIKCLIRGKTTSRVGGNELVAARLTMSKLHFRAIEFGPRFIG